MYRIIPSIFLGALSLIGIALCEEIPSTPGASIIPAPGKCEIAAGTFVLSPQTTIVWRGDEAGKSSQALDGGLIEQIGLDLPTSAWTGTDAPANSILLEQIPANGLPAPAGSEAYTLAVTPSGITVRAGSASGLFYGVQSLLQMTSTRSAGRGQPIYLPAMTIEDSPRFEWRGVMIDESRHFFGKQVVKGLLDTMASLKMNRLHWHLTDEPGWRIEIKKYPKLTTIGGHGSWSDPAAPAAFYTQADIREIVEYAGQRHIMIIPEIDMPGHANAACRAYPELSGGGEGQWQGFTFNPAKEETYRFLEDVLREVAALFPGPYLHLGGDEVHFGNQSWSTDPGIVKFTRDQGFTNPVQLEQYFVRRMAGVIQRLGKTTMGWDEIAGAGVAPADSALMWWRHDKPQLLGELLKRDFRVVLCPRIPCYFDFVQDESHQHGRKWQGAFVPLAGVHQFPSAEITELIPAGKEANVLGIQACLWTERIQSRERLDFMTYPRIAALAEAAWTPAVTKGESSFFDRLPGFLRELDRRKVRYFDPFDPAKTPEPPGPEKKKGGTADG